MGGAAAPRAGGSNGSAGHRGVGCLVVASACVLLAIVTVRPLLEAYAAWLEVEDREEPARVAVVLEGGKGERLGEALDIYKRRVVTRLLITGQAEPVLPVYSGGPTITQAEAKRDIAVRLGVPADSVQILLGPSSTYEEARAVLGWCRERLIGSVTVVTSPFHSRRARAVFRHVFRGSGIRVRLAHAPFDAATSSPRRWWTREKDLVAVFDESVKGLYYLWKYRISPF